MLDAECAELWVPVRKIGYQIARKIEVQGFNSTELLRLLNRIRTPGEAGKLWEDVAIELDRIRFKLDGQTPPNKLRRGRKSNTSRDNAILKAANSGLYTHKEIGQQFGGISRSAIGHAIARAKGRNKRKVNKSL